MCDLESPPASPTHIDRLLFHTHPLHPCQNTMATHTRHLYHKDLACISAVEVYLLSLLDSFAQTLPELWDFSSKNICLIIKNSQII